MRSNWNWRNSEPRLPHPTSAAIGEQANRASTSASRRSSRREKNRRVYSSAPANSAAMATGLNSM